MVSLNEKRSKIRYLVQNKSDWNQEQSQYGKKILEKMGWTSNVGLGKNEDGQKEHLQVQFKSNNKGLGFIRPKSDSTWIEHSYSFDNLLQQLNQSHSTRKHSSDPSSSLTNFTEHLQQTKTRFNYKKQTSSKDLSQRTNEDFQSIFGPSNANQTERNSFEEQLLDNEQKEEEEEEEEEHFYIKSHLSIEQYFKEKLKNKVHRRIDFQEEHRIDSKEMHVDRSNQSKSWKEIDDQNEEIIFSNSNLMKVQGYQGWNIPSDFNRIVKLKDKQRKRKRKDLC